MAKMFNRARMTVTSTGTGALSLGVAVAGYQTFSSAGAQNGDSVSYAVEDGLKWEIGTGQYNSVAGTLSRTVTQSFDGTTYGTSPISVTTSAQVFISPLAADLQYGTSAGNLVQLDGSARLPAVDGSLVTGLNATNITNGTLSVSRGGTGLTSLTAGYIPFGGSSTYSSDSNLFWDNTNKRLGVGTATPTAVLSVFSASASPTSVANGVRFLESTNGYGLNLGGSSTGYAWIQGVYGGSSTLGYNNISIQPNGGSVGIGNTSPAYKLDVTGAIRSSNAGNGNVWLSDGTYQSSLQQNSTDLYLNANAGGAANGGFIWRSSNSYTTRMTLDASGNLGLGVTPSAWDSLYRVFQIGGNPALASDQAGQWVANAYYNAGWKYISNNYAARYEINKSNGGIHAWYNAPSGTAGTAITFTPAMTLDASGCLAIADTSVPTNFRVKILGTAGSNTGPASSGTTQSASASIRIQAGGGFTGTLDIGQGGGTGSWLQSCDTTNLATNYPLLLNPNGGNVGIGTTSPQSLLDLTGNDPTIRLTDNAGSPTATWSMRSTDGTYVIRSVTAGSDRLVIDTSGNLLVGTTTTGGGKVCVKNTPSSQWGIDFNECQVTISNAANYTLAVGSGLVVINDISQTGSCAVYVLGAGWSTLLNQSNTTGAYYVTGTTSPAAGKISIGWDGTNYRIYNNYGSSITFGLIMLRSRSAN